MANATAILCADLHFRSDVPKARTDDFQEAMWNKWRTVLKLAHENNNCPILIAGDLGDKPEWPNWLLEKFISEWMNYEVPIIVIPGQHDLPGHNIEMIDRAALGVLSAAGVVNVLTEEWENINEIFSIYSFPYNFPLVEKRYKICEDTINIAMTHQLVIEGNEAEWKGQNMTTAMGLLKSFPDYDLILSGDNHQSFVAEHEGRLLINPGSMMRSTAAQISHRPRVFLWYAETNTYSAHYLPIKRNVLSRDHLEKVEEKERRMDAFILSVKNRQELKLSFEDNMEAHLVDNPVTESVENKIWVSME